MEKKVNLFGILGIVVLMAVATMGSVKYQHVPRLSSGLAAPVMACLPGSFSDNFRSAQLWRNRIIPPVEVTAGLGLPANACLTGLVGDNFRLAHMWNGYFVPSMDLTGVVSRPWLWNSGH